MNFKELLKKYREGRISEEEKKFVEAEMEKYTAIEEYLANDLFEDSLLDENTEEEISNNKKTEIKSIRKTVNRRLAKVVLISVLTVVILYIGIFHGISALVNMMYYNPSAVSSQKEEYQRTDFYYDMQAYVSLNIPGNSMSSFTWEEAKGFGNYELSYALENLFIKENSRHFLSISRNRRTYAVDGIYSLKNMFNIWEGFEQIKYFYDEEEEDIISSRERRLNRKNEGSLSFLNQLNPLAYVSMTIVFQEDLSMEELYNLSIDTSPLKFKWIGIRTVEPGSQWGENQPMHLIGFNPRYNDEASIGQRPDDIKYPLFYLHPRMIMDDPDLSKLDYPEAMSKAYEIHFKSRLEYLRNRQEFVKVFDYNYYKSDFYNNSLNYIDEHGVKTYGVLVYGTAEEFLEKLDHIPYESLYINEVLVTKPNIY